MNNFFKTKLMAARSEKGAIALLVSFFVMMIILLIALAVGTIMVLEVKMSREIANSIPAFYAADAGAEQCLFEARDDGTVGFCATVGGSINCSLVNNCVLDNLATIESARRTNSKTIQSIGVYGATKRKIEVNWQ